MQPNVAGMILGLSPLKLKIIKHIENSGRVVTSREESFLSEIQIRA